MSETQIPTIKTFEDQMKAYRDQVEWLNKYTNDSRSNSPQLEAAVQNHKIMLFDKMSKVLNMHIIGKEY